MKYTNFIGIDVSKYKVDIYMTKGKRHEVVVNTKIPLEKFFKQIKSEGSFVVLENTGGYEKMCIKVLLKLGFTVHRANNNKVNAFIKLKGTKAKTDKIDAYMLALYGQQEYKELEIYQPVEDGFDNMKQLALYLVELKNIRASQKNRLKSPGRDLVKEEVERFIESISNEIKRVETDLIQKIETNKGLKQKLKLICKYKGIGEVTGIQLILLLPELGELPKRAIVSLSGLAPSTKQSGTIKKKGTTKGPGRKSIKSMMYMATISALRFNPQIKKFYDRLVKIGKKKMVALIASMRKIIVHLNAIMRDKEVRYDKY